jgi:hypothetical protein
MKSKAASQGCLPVQHWHASRRAAKSGGATAPRPGHGQSDPAPMAIAGRRAHLDGSAVGRVPPAMRSIIPDAAPFRTIMTYADVSAAEALAARIPGMSPQARFADLERENTYLLQRNAQLQADIVALGSELDRTRQMLERLHGRAPALAPNPLSGGQ